MKWTNKGHELDKRYNYLRDTFSLTKQVYCFGAGDTAKDIYPSLKKFLNVAAFIDNDPKKYEELFLGKKVISFEQYMSNHNDSYIILTTSDLYQDEIEDELKSFGLKENVDYMKADTFYSDVLPILLYYENGIIFNYLCQISLTERCSLKCKHCAHACNLVPMSREDLTLEQAKSSADSFFSIVDYAQEFVLIGGEPLLYRHLPEIIMYIGDKYREKINVFSITTNGSIIPSDEVLELCQKYKVMFRISNYSLSVPRLVDKYNVLEKKLCEYNIRFIIGSSEGTWMDYGFEYVDRHNDEKELIRVFDECRTPCREIRENRYYYCVMARAVAENKFHCKLGKDDFFDMKSSSIEKTKKEFFEYNQGFSDKGYLDTCNHCNGKECYKHPIPMAEQMV